MRSYISSATTQLRNERSKRRMEKYKNEGEIKKMRKNRMKE